MPFRHWFIGHNSDSSSRRGPAAVAPPLNRGRRGCAGRGGGRRRRHPARRRRLLYDLPPDSPRGYDGMRQGVQRVPCAASRPGPRQDPYRAGARRAGRRGRPEARRGWPRERRARGRDHEGRITAGGSVMPSCQFSAIQAIPSDLGAHTPANVGVILYDPSRNIAYRKLTDNWQEVFRITGFRYSPRDGEPAEQGPFSVGRRLPGEPGKGPVHGQPAGNAAQEPGTL